MTKYAPVNIGVIGSGNISGIYLEMGQTFEILKIAALADLVRERAENQAELCVKILEETGVFNQLSINTTSHYPCR